MSLFTKKRADQAELPPLPRFDDERPKNTSPPHFPVTLRDGVLKATPAYEPTFTPSQAPPSGQVTILPPPVVKKEEPQKEPVIEEKKPTTSAFTFPELPKREPAFIRSQPVYHTAEGEEPPEKPKNLTLQPAPQKSVQALPPIMPARIQHAPLEEREHTPEATPQDLGVDLIQKIRQQKNQPLTPPQSRPPQLTQQPQPPRDISNVLEKIRAQQQKNLPPILKKEEPLQKEPVMKQQRTTLGGSIAGLSMSPTMEQRPIFVQLDNYQYALKSIEAIKSKIQETEHLLKNIEDIKAQEKVELANADANLAKIKEKLVEIDKRLFEL